MRDGQYFVIQPTWRPWGYQPPPDGVCLCPSPASLYRSDSNDEWYTREQIAALLAEGSEPVLPYGRQSITEDDIEAVVAVLRSDWLTTGPLVTEFEQRLTQLAGGHRAVSCTSGTAALHIAYSAAGVGRGDEVVCTPMTFVAPSASTASLPLGASVVFADVEPDTALIDPSVVGAAGQLSHPGGDRGLLRGPARGLRGTPVGRGRGRSADPGGRRSLHRWVLGRAPRRRTSST